jgi:hypothetical protein
METRRGINWMAASLVAMGILRGADNRPNAGDGTCVGSCLRLRVELNQETMIPMNGEDADVAYSCH